MSENINNKYKIDSDKKTDLIFGLIPAVCVLLILLSGCGGSANYQDGVYEGRSSVYEVLEEDAEEDEGGDGYGVVEIKIEDNIITACTYTPYQTDGTVKDEEYGKTKNGAVANQDYYNKAQRAVRACQAYADQLAAEGDLKSVDAISGATVSYDQFQEAVRDALDKAKA